ncbi:MAG: adenylate/guanylate cyclase domain-containing protein [Bacteroidota bacterium]
MSKKRKLAAILFADIVGYTAMMQTDEVQARQNLEKFRTTLEEQVSLHQGEIINYYGDGCLCTFNSAVDAMTCAKAVQLLFQENPKVPVRIGLHSGDVFFEDDNVFGDSVNIASRIESLGVAGAVLFSKRIKRDIDNQTIFDITPVGEFEFKNVNKSMDIFALANDGFIVPKKSEMRGKVKPSTPTKAAKSTANLRWIVPAILVGIVAGVFFFFYQKQSVTITSKENIEQMEKSIAVLPFRDLSPEGNQVYFADGIVEAIRSKLAQVGNLKVTSMTSVLGYRDNPKPIGVIAKELKVEHILEGTVYRADNKVRVIAQLINAQTDEHLWAETYDEELTDIFAIQSKIANVVTQALKARLTHEEQVKLTKTISTSINAYDIVLSAEAALNAFQKNNLLPYLVEAIQKYEQAIVIDPALDKAYEGLSKVWYEKYWLGEGDNITLDSSYYYAQKAIELNPYNDGAYLSLGYVEWRRKNFLTSKQATEKALNLAPNNSDALILLARYYGIVEQSPEKQLPLLIKAIALDPQNRATPDGNLSVFLNIASIYHNADLNVEAEKLYRKALRLYPNAAGSYGALGWFTFTQGNYEETIPLGKKKLDLAGGENAPLWAIDGYAVQLFYASRYEEAEKYYRILQNRIDSGFVENPYQHIYRHRLAAILLETGRTEEGQQLMDEHIQLCLAQIKDGTVHNSQEYDLAAAYAYVGDKEKAYEWLEKVKYQPFMHKFMRLDPFFDSLRDEDRFKKVMAKGDEQVRRFRNTLKNMEVEGQLILLGE